MTYAASVRRFRACFIVAIVGLAAVVVNCSNLTLYEQFGTGGDGGPPDIGVPDLVVVADANFEAGGEAGSDGPFDAPNLEAGGEAGFDAFDAPNLEAGGEGGIDAAVDGPSLEAGGEGGIDATVDAASDAPPDAAIDAAVDAASDGGDADASGSNDASTTDASATDAGGADAAPDAGANPNGGGAFEQTSFYACGVASGGALASMLPILVACGLALRRRSVSRRGYDCTTAETKPK